MKKRHTPEQIIAKLREAEIALSKGQPIARVVRQLGITEQTYYRWRKEYGGLRTDQAKQLEQENARLKKVVAELTPDNAILKEVADPNFFRRHPAGQPGRCTFQPTTGIPPGAALFNRRLHPTVISVHSTPSRLTRTPPRSFAASADSVQLCTPRLTVVRPQA